MAIEKEISAALWATQPTLHRYINTKDAAVEPAEVVVQRRQEGLQTPCSHAELYQQDDAVGRVC